MALSLLDMLTSPSSDVDLNNSKKLLCTLAFDGGGLDVTIELLNSNRQAVKKDGGDNDDGDGEGDGEDDEVRYSLSSVKGRNNNNNEDIAKRIILNILEADRPRRAGGVAPAFLRACCMGWLRRAPGVLVGGQTRGDGTMQRISLLMISRALEFGGNKHINFDESGGSKAGDGKRATTMALAQQSTTNALRSGSADNLTKAATKVGRRQSMGRLPTKKQGGGKEGGGERSSSS
ncbi:hypothetical protein TL16_g01787 [Triparma laevis f. inornata]|uniref:Uncharacterized protein n=1 Tax=Triparma laevis f. inornata TaxID=1714386 RepID=A0A9W6ZR28_9STRA|nr:hypothetical protein TL16_g01787 [Triparma laevis f. inornata]